MQKKWVIGITAVSLAAVTAIGSTLAYFTATTQKMENDFTVKAPNGISAQLREKDWDGYDFGHMVPYTDASGTAKERDPNGSDAFPDASGLGIDMAKTVMPDELIPKNPKLMNTTNWDFTKNDGKGGLQDDKSSVPVYMAMKITYSPDFVHANEFIMNSQKVAGVNSGWVKLDCTSGEDCEVYVWCGDAAGLVPKAVASGEKINTALFNSVKINEEAKSLLNDDITLMGAAVQADNLNATSNLQTIKEQFAKELNVTLK